jgi:tRNA (cytidine/uridine-2'-O-)-methyltransferase
MLRIALYQPDIPQNTGTILRMASCMDVAVDIIEPAGFQLGDSRFRRALMDYADHLDMTRHASWNAFLETIGSSRLVLLTTSGQTSLYNAEFRQNDILVMGRESAGVPDDLHQRADLRIMVPMTSGARSLNIAVTAAMALGEALRQTRFTGEMP